MFSWLKRLWSPKPAPWPPRPWPPPPSLVRPVSPPRGVASLHGEEEALFPLRSAVGLAQDGLPGHGGGVSMNRGGVDRAVAEWFASQEGLPLEICEIMARHWLIDKAIREPAESAIRQGYEIDSEDGAVLGILERADKEHEVSQRLQELVTSARRVGGAVGLFLTCPLLMDRSEYYEAPLNVEAVTYYGGIRVISASDVTPEPLAEEVSDPAHPRYMRPTYYRIGGVRYHHSHLITCTPYPVAYRLRAHYRFFGVPLPERIYSRVYNAERTADEAPLLALTKRLKTLGVDLRDLMESEGGIDLLKSNVNALREFADNSGVFVYDTGGSGSGMQQLDTSLADLDSVIMTQFQLVAAACEVPATKLLGTSPRGFDATGESEAENYRQHLEAIQTSFFEPLLHRHHEIVCALNSIPETPSITWAALDSPTAKEYAEIDSLNAGSLRGLVDSGIVSPNQARHILHNAKESVFYQHLHDDDLLSETDREIDALIAGLEGEVENGSGDEDDSEA